MSKPSDALLYFAYGANMSSEKLRQRGVQLSRLSPAQVADPSICLGFSHRNGFATLVALDTLGSDVRYVYRQPHGVLYRITPRDLDTLRAAEQGYYLHDITVTPYVPLPRDLASDSSAVKQNSTRVAAASGERADISENGAAEPGGKPGWQFRSAGDGFPPTGGGDGGEDGEGHVRAVAFFSNPWVLLDRSLPPRERYLNLLRAGARENRVARDYVMWLEGLESVPAGRMLGREYQESMQDKGLSALAACLAVGFAAFWLARMP
jgi:hypothetical protein